ncbi:SRPBCC family protein [Escherichia coli]
MYQLVIMFSLSSVFAGLYRKSDSGSLDSWADDCCGRWCRGWGISKTFTTRNQLTSNQTISTSLVDGPFKKLIGGWKFTPLSQDACRIEFTPL